jgi:hypothetical protein
MKNLSTVNFLPDRDEKKVGFKNRMNSRYFRLQK